MATQSTQAPKPAATGKPAIPGRKKLTPAELETRKAALKAESKSARFQRLAKPRVAKAVKAIRALKPMGTGSQYDYTQEQANRVLQYLTDAVAEVKTAFAPRSRGSKAAQELIDL